MAETAGTVAVEVVPDASGWARSLRNQVLGSAGSLGVEWGRTFGAAAAKAIGDSVSDGVDKSARKAKDKAPAQGAETAGAFADAFKRRLELALKALPDPALGLDLSPAERALAELYEEIHALSKEQVGVEISDDEALLKIAELKAQLIELGAQSESIAVRVNTASAVAELEAFEAFVKARAAAAGRESGEEFGGRFADHLRSRLSAAMASLPTAHLTADSSDVDRAVAAIRIELETLRDKRIGIDITDAEALIQMDLLRARLDELAARTVDVRVKVDLAAASAELAAFRAEVDAAGNSNAFSGISNGAEGGRIRILALTAAIFGLGPALIPIVAVAAAAMGAIAIGAIAAAGAVAVLLLALGPVVQAIQAVTKAHQQSSAAASSAASRAVALANAQDGLASATRSLAATEADTASQRISADERIADAKRRVGDVARQNATAIENADAAIKRAEDGLASAQRDALKAQQSLADARKQYALDQEDLSSRIANGALNERQAQLRLTEAQLGLEKAKADPRKTDLDRQAAQLAVDEAVQGLSDQQRENKRLADQKADADKKGIDGSNAVKTAQERLVEANKKVADSEQEVITATRDRANAQVKAAEDSAAAQRQVTDAVRESQDQQRHAADALLSAQQAVIQAQRGVTQAATATGGAADVAAQKLANLSPAGLEFVDFIDKDLKPKLIDLSKEVQTGFLPGLEEGLKTLEPGFGGFKRFIGDLSTEMGKLATAAAKAMTGPFWRQFFTFIKSTAVPALDKMGTTIGNVVTGFAGLIQAFWPVVSNFGDGLLTLSTNFATFGTTAGSNQQFQGFLRYVKDNGPLVFQTLKDLIGAAKDIVVALAPVGVVVLGMVDAFAKLISIMPPGVLQAIVVGIGGIATALLLFRGVDKAIDSVNLVFGRLDGALGKVGVSAGTAKSAMLGLTVGLAAISALDALAHSGDSAQATLNQTVAALDRLKNSGSTDALDKIFQATSNYDNDDVKGFTDALDRLANPDLNQKLNNLSSTLTGGLIKSGNEDMIAQFDQIGTHLADLVNSGNAAEAARLFGLMADKTTAAGGSITDLNKYMPQYQDALLGVKNKAQDAAEASKALAEQTRKVADDTLAARDAENGYYAALDAASQAVKDNGATLDVHTQKGRDNREALDNLAGAANKYAQQLADNGTSEKTIQKQLDTSKQKLVDEGVKFGLTKDEAKKYADQVLKVPTKQTTTITTPGSAAATTAVKTLKTATDEAKTSADKMADAHKSMWDKIKGWAMTPIHFVLDMVLNKGLLAAWNNIKGWFTGTYGTSKVNVPFAAGGYTGDGGKWDPAGIVHAGEFVFPQEAVQRIGVSNLGSMAGLPGYASGGIVGKIGGAISGGASALLGLFTDPAKWIKDAVAGSVSGIGGGAFGATLSGGVSSLVDLLIAKVKGMVPSFGGGGSGVQQWAGVAAQALAMAGAPASWLGSLLARMQRESGGNPNAINLWDSNALAGHPSQGLMQTIPGTFNAYAGSLRSRGITDPLANIYAAIRYTVDRYGSGPAGWDRPGGYDSGGYLPPGLSSVYNGTGRPEPVLTGKQWDAITAGGRTISIQNLNVDATSSFRNLDALSHADRIKFTRDIRDNLVKLEGASR